MHFECESFTHPREGVRMGLSCYLFLIRIKQVGLHTHRETHIHKAFPYTTPGWGELRIHFPAEEGSQMLIRFCSKRSSFWAREHLKWHSIVLQAKTLCDLLLMFPLHSHYLLCDVYEHPNTSLKSQHVSFSGSPRLYVQFSKMSFISQNPSFLLPTSNKTLKIFQTLNYLSGELSANILFPGVLI